MRIAGVGRRLIVLTLGVLGLLAGAAQAVAAPAVTGEGWASDWGATGRGAVRLVAAPGAAAGDLRLGLQFRLEPGWKIYWRSPGSAGLPPEVDWTGTRNLTIGRTDWPVPLRFSTYGLDTFGYEGDVVLPIAARQPQPGEASRVQAAVDFLTCKVLCVPNHVALQFDLPVGGPGTGRTEFSPWAAVLDRWSGKVPRAGAAGLAILGAASGGAGKSAFLDVDIAAVPPLLDPDMIVENGAPGVFGRPVLRLGPTGRPVLRLAAPDDATGALGRLAGQRLTVTVMDRAASEADPRAVTADIVPVRAAVAEAAGLSVSILALALLGGFILNFMPCVLPVLSIKLLGLVAHDADRKRLRLGFLASATGILAAFLAMAVILIGLKLAGRTVGWGIQFQEPIFLAVLAAIVVGFAGNLLGFYGIPLPVWLVGRVAGIGGAGMGRPSLRASFLAGAFAALLATPCSAPFLGTAIGFALAGDGTDIFAVFACLGLGLSAPYLLVATAPGIVRVLPRPGRWMETLRRVLGLLLMGTAVWLVSVIAAQTGTIPAVVTGSLALAALVGMALSGRVHSGAVPALRWAPVALLLAMPVAIVFLPAAAESTVRTAGWRSYDESALANAVASGQTVFVDVTARWCLTCQVNDRLVLESEIVRRRLSGPGIVAMRADWTRPNLRIANLLHDFGRFGIPFDVVFGPGAPQGIVLPELLTTKAVLDAVTRAQRPGSGT